MAALNQEARKGYSSHWQYSRKTAKWCEKYPHQQKYVALGKCVWKTCCKVKSTALKIEEHEPAELKSLIEKFYAEMKKQIRSSCTSFTRFFSYFYIIMGGHKVLFVQFGINLQKRFVQFHLVEKFTCANWFQIEIETVWLPIQIRK